MEENNKEVKTEEFKPVKRKHQKLSPAATVILTIVAALRNYCFRCCDDCNI